MLVKVMAIILDEDEKIRTMEIMAMIKAMEIPGNKKGALVMFVGQSPAFSAPD